MRPNCKKCRNADCGCKQREELEKMGRVGDLCTGFAKMKEWGIVRIADMAEPDVPKVSFYLWNEEGVQGTFDLVFYVFEEATAFFKELKVWMRGECEEDKAELGGMTD